MATYKTIGIVLKRHNLGEADRIVTFITADRGKLKAVARGVRRIGSRQAGHLELFSRVELMLAEGRNLDIVTSARLRHYPEPVALDYQRLRLGFIFASLLDRLIEGDRGYGVYELALAGFDELERSGASAQVELWFKLRLLELLGYRPNLEHCRRCEAVLTAESFIDAAAGGVVCARHGAALDGGEYQAAPANLAPIEPGGLVLWRRLLDTERLRVAADDEPQASATLPVCDTFYEYIFGRAFGAVI